MKARLFTDGGARGNPGPAAYGFVLEAEDGTVLAAEGEAIGVATNNVAEYSGLIAGLREGGRAAACREVEVVSDSELMVKQMRGEYRVKNDALRELSVEAGRLARQLGNVEYRHVKRAHNELADKLVNDALDARMSVTIRSAPRSRRATRTRPSRLLADDVVFRSPAVYKPYQGREQVEAILRLVATVFENFRYTNEWRDGRTTILFFEANVGDRDLQGIDILEEDDDGLVERFTVMIRPLSGLQAVAGTMAARLGLA